jgi:thymidine phosphorylase
LSWVVANLTQALAEVRTHRSAEKAAINKLSRGKAMREAREYMADQKLGDFKLLDLIPHVPNAATENALQDSRAGATSQVLED